MQAPWTHVQLHQCTFVIVYHNLKQQIHLSQLTKDGLGYTKACSLEAKTVNYEETKAKYKVLKTPKLLDMQASSSAHLSSQRKKV